MKLRSDTHSFRGGRDPVNKWEIVERPTKMTWWEKTTGTFEVGVWPIAQAKKVYVPLNRLDVIRPTNPKDAIQYFIDTVTVEYRGVPRSLKHAFQTRPVETMGDRNGQCKIGETTNLVALVTEILSVDFEIYNPYLAIMRIQEAAGVVNFMQHLNETLQSVAREITAKFTYEQIIKATVEGNDGNADTKFGDKFKEMANGALAKYGIRITNVDLVDHFLDPESEQDLLASQREKMKAEANIINAEGSKRVKELNAHGDAAVLRTIMKEAKGDPNIVLAELERRGRTDAARFAGEKFQGEFLTLSFGGPNSGQPGPTPAVTVGAVSPKEKKGDQNKQQEKKKRS
ncbi:MAG: SPFH domain-containing protein [Candidatus Paceibacterota bacterium]